MMNRMMLLSAVFACALSARAESVEIMIYNPAGFARENEIAEIVLLSSFLRIRKVRRFHGRRHMTGKYCFR